MLTEVQPQLQRSTLHWHAMATKVLSSTTFSGPRNGLFREPVLEQCQCLACWDSCKVALVVAATFHHRSRLPLCLAKRQACSLLQLQPNRHKAAGAEIAPRWLGPLCA